MGSDLSMNPPREARYVVLVSVGLGAVAVYKYPGEFDNELTAGVWHRVYFIHFTNTEVEVREAVVTAVKALGQQIKEVESDAVMERVIHPETMRDVLYPKPPVCEPRHA